MIFKTISTNILIQSLTFATSVITARLLGPVGRGELALVLLYPMLVANIFFIGVDRAIAFQGGRGELEHPGPTVLRLAVLLAVPAMIAGYAAVQWRVVDAHLSTLAIVYIAHVPGVYLFTLVVNLFNGIGDFRRFNRARIWFFVMNFILVSGIWAATTTALLDWVVLANLASVYVAMFMAMWYFLGRTDLVAHTPSGMNEVLAVLRVAAVFAPAAVLANISGAAYQILLEYHMGVGPLGLFVVLYTYSRLLSSVGTAVGSHLFHLGIAGDQANIAQIYRQSTLVYLLCALPLWMVSGWMIPVVYGRAFSADPRIIGSLLVSCVFSLMADNMTEYLKGRKNVGVDVTGRLIYLISLVALGWNLVLANGLIGLSISLAASDMLRYTYVVHRISRETGIPAAKFWRLSMADLSSLFHAGKQVLLQGKV